MKSQSNDDGPLVKRISWGLRRSDQPLVAGFIACCLLGMIAYFLIQSTGSGGLIDIDEARPYNARFSVDINSASWPELANLPGIGETYARSIVQYREEHGAFGLHEELMEIPGIGPRTLVKLQPYLAPIPKSTSPPPDSP